jgi:hypothetical protein
MLARRRGVAGRGAAISGKGRTGHGKDQRNDKRMTGCRTSRAL